ncbi:Acyl-CoA N-acyltransferase [Penicillium coprophilum]|uniref:Acyl-CoA N-acyltransferase n=1 Tax=Penicillium coprophilum TaxID=36646 RepID=UPI00238D8F1A|nr:Acyl-CoA N-acyltransferase [Penicillium coprophilum]KAJ5171343.1 Acyl-CoA N-acyltransferase [Penicillium coprophilum]
MDLFRSGRLEYHSFNSPEDDDFFHSIQSDPVAFTNSCASLIRPTTRQFTENIKKYIIDNSLLFVVIYRTGYDERIGTIFLKSASSDMAHHRCSEFGIDIKKEYQSQGYGAEAINWMLDWAFKNAGLHRVECNVFGWNARAQNIYQRLGFREEGRRRECLFRDDKWWDEVHMGILKKEWQQIRQ